MMKRRMFMTSAAAASAVPTSFAIAQPAKARTLKFVPQANLTVLDPIFTTAQPTVHHGWAIYDLLFGVTSKLEPKPQMPRVWKEEVFGPHVALVPFRTDEEAARLANDSEYGLSLAVITESYRRMRFFREECDYGMGYVNLPCIGAEVHLPFGGVKKSGNGHPSAAGLVEAVTHKVAWTVNHGEEIRMAQGLTAEV